jgi:hypothetical protein
MATGTGQLKHSPYIVKIFQCTFFTPHRAAIVKFLPSSSGMLKLLTFQSNLPHSGTAGTPDVSEGFVAFFMDGKITDVSEKRAASFLIGKNYIIYVSEELVAETFKEIFQQKNLQ